MRSKTKSNQKGAFSLLLKATQKKEDSVNKLQSLTIIIYSCFSLLNFELLHNDQHSVLLNLIIIA